MILNRKHLINILFLLTNIILFYRYVTQVNGFFVNNFGKITLLLLIIFYVLSGMKFLLNKKNFVLYGILCCGLLLMFIKAFILPGDFPVNIIINIILSTLIGIVMVGNGLEQIYQLIFLILVHGYISFSYIQGTIAEELLKNYSYNHISVILIYSTVLFYISYNSLDIKIKNYSILPALSCMMLSIFSFGRSGMFSSTILFLCLFFIKYKYMLFNHKNIWTKILYFILFILFLFGINNFISFALENNYFYRFEQIGTESEGRELIIKSYFGNLSDIGWFLGNNGDYFLETSGYTAHISYLSWHNSFGFVSIILLAYTFYSFFKYSKKGKDNHFYYMSLFMIVLLRSSTDDILLFGGLMFGILIIILVMFCHHN